MTIKDYDQQTLEGSVSVGELIGILSKYPKDMKFFSILKKMKKYKDHKCMVCDKEFLSTHSHVRYCGKQCSNYSATDKFLKWGIKPTQAPKKFMYRKIMPSH